MKKYKSEIKGHLEITVGDMEDEHNGVVEKWKEIFIHGDPEGLKSLAKLLVKIARINQDNIAELPIGAKEHTSLRPNWDLSKNSEQVIVGRLDGKGTGIFHNGYLKREN